VRAQISARLGSSIAWRSRAAGASADPRASNLINSPLHEDQAYPFVPGILSTAIMAARRCRWEWRCAQTTRTRPSCMA